MRRRRISHAFARKVADKGSQKTKVKAIISLLAFAGSGIQTSDIASAVDTARVNYFDIFVKPFSKIQILHFDIAIYQSGSSVSADGFVDWCLVKNPANSLPITANAPLGSTLAYVPYIFKTGRAAVPQQSATGLPCIYHLSGDIKIPPRFQTMAPNDKLTLAFYGTPSGAGITYSVNGTVTYMFKV